MATALGSVPAGFGRIVFFRSNSFVGAGVQPNIRVDGTLGTAWSADFLRPPGGSCPGGFSLQSRVVSVEPMTTPMGELLVQRVDVEGKVQRMERYTILISVNARAWYSPQLARIVRFESELVPNYGAPERELVELVEIRRD